MAHAHVDNLRMYFLGQTGMAGYFLFAFIMSGMSFMMMGAGKGCAEGKPPETLSPAPQSISVYALSRGKGLPDQARNVLAQSRNLLKAAQERGEVSRVIEQRIGIEGETKLCAEFSHAESAGILSKQIHQLGQGVDLITVKDEPCLP